MRILIGIYAAVALGAGGGQAVAQDRVEGLSAAQLFDLADARKEAEAFDDALVVYEALSSDPDPEIRAEARYRKGLLLADMGRFEAAAGAFRDVLSERPEAIAARLELARMLAAIGRHGEARRELGQAQKIGIPAQAAPMVEQFAAALRSSRRLGGSVEFALAPDSNINRATQARTLDTIIAPLTLSDDARAQSGLGVRTTGQIFARLPLSESVSLVPRLAGLGNLYDDDRFNDLSASGLMGLEWRGQSDRLSPSIGATYRWFAGERYAQTRTISVDWLRRLGPDSQLVVSGSAAQVRYDRNNLQDGGLFDVSASYERTFGEAMGGSVTLSATRQTARDPGYATWGGGANVGVWRQASWGVLFASSGLRRTEGDERLFLFPERRKEWLWTARAGVILQALSIRGMAPTLRLHVEDNDSTVGIYDYSRFAAEFGFTRRF
ncbi:DUF560 domain-containing protein [Brevundimonas sp. BAL450]|uniref:surface lipoprotein assembly modifier n=1 Tax=Brevundimonas sp. BAL450 TaxID=1708162 RepID=UPI0018CAD7BD|nr:surface lipoprotein assembly modifier [Brevundimonas sp. BAL450]MBG7614629.1 DUF560 domain-containing protein [Brevundimonas sp. BAL450]